MSDSYTEIASNKIEHRSDPAESEDIWTENPVIFRNSDRERLFGMVYRPKKLLPTKRVGILICVNAVKYRIGSFRYHTTLARHLSRIGYYVMNFDPAGIGDSEGVFEEKYLYEHYCDIQKGKYSHDIIDAVTFFKSQCKLDEVVLLGLCGGAISCLIASSKYKKIEGLILLGIPVLLDFVEEKKQKFDKASTITSSKYAVSVLVAMLQKLATNETWANIFNRKVQWKNELRIFFKAIKVVIVEHAMRLVFKRRKDYIDVDNMSEHQRYNPIFHQSMLNYFSIKRKVLFVFGELDYMTWVFKSEFQDRVLVPNNPYEDLYELYVIEKANHIFSLKDSQVELSKIIERWLLTHFSLF
jgi:uncharacterized protein